MFRTIAILLILVSAGIARADVFMLTTGGQVRGELVNRDESPRKTFVIRTAAGQLTLDKAQVKEVVPQSAAQAEYEELAPKAADTIEGQWQIAEWCRERRLTRERAPHLERIIELDPNHKGARLALGYSMIEGRWIRPDQYMEERGYIRHQGKWRLPQEIEVLARKQKDEVAERAWFVKVKRLRNAIDDGHLGTKAREELTAIDDPAAVPALTQSLNNETVGWIRPLYVVALGKIGSGAAMQELVALSLEDEDEEVRQSALDQLTGRHDAQVISTFVAALRSKDNVQVNRGAAGLARVKDRSTVSPLIDALVTRHKYRTSGGGNSNQISAAFNKDGGNNMGGSGMGGMSMGAPPVRTVVQDLTNREVLAALATITGVNFGYDVKAWRYWYASQKKPEAADVRRD